MGRRKIKMQAIEHTSSRRATFEKRRIGLLKKAMELSILCSSTVSVSIYNPDGDIYVYSSEPYENVVNKFREYCGSYRLLTNANYDDMVPGKASSSNVGFEVYKESELPYSYNNNNNNHHHNTHISPHNQLHHHGHHNAHRHSTGNFNMSSINNPYMSPRAMNMNNLYPPQITPSFNGHSQNRMHNNNNIGFNNNTNHMSNNNSQNITKIKQEKESNQIFTSSSNSGSRGSESSNTSSRKRSINESLQSDIKMNDLEFDKNAFIDSIIKPNKGEKRNRIGNVSKDFDLMDLKMPDTNSNDISLDENKLNDGFPLDGLNPLSSLDGNIFLN